MLVILQLKRLPGKKWQKMKGVSGHWLKTGRDAVVIFSAELKPIYASPTLTKLLGYSEKEAMPL
jgi:PAS domain-containing protein